MKNLPLQVGQVHRVAIGQGDLADTGGSEVQGRGRAETAGADDQHMRADDARLALDADRVEQDMSAVAEKLFVVHFREGRLRRKLRNGATACAAFFVR